MIREIKESSRKILSFSFFLSFFPPNESFRFLIIEAERNEVYSSILWSLKLIY